MNLRLIVCVWELQGVKVVSTYDSYAVYKVVALESKRVKSISVHLLPQLNRSYKRRIIERHVFSQQL